LCCACSSTSGGGTKGSSFAGTGADLGQAGESQQPDNAGGNTAGGASSSSGGDSGDSGDSGSAGASAGGGASTSADACPQVNTECGGDLVGTWKYDSTCGPLPASDITSGSLMGCMGVTLTLVPQDATLVTFRADGTYSDSGGEVVTETIHVPKACFNGQPCSIAGTMMTGAGFTASDAGATCDLTTIEMNPPSDDTGTYTVSGNTLAQDKGGLSGSFCVTGKTLVVGATASGEIAYITFTKQ
jgi:hypothetical protein